MNSAATPESGQDRPEQNPYHGQPSAGGQPSSQAYQGQSYQGQDYQSPAYQSQAYQGQAYQGQRYQGQPYPGQPTQGQPGQSGPGRARRGPGHAVKRATIAIGAALGLLVAGAIGGVGIGVAVADGQIQEAYAQQRAQVPEEDSSAQGQLEQTDPWDDLQQQEQQQLPDSGFPEGASPEGGSDGTSASIDAEPASESESAGIVLIATVLEYQGAESAGTGIVIGSDGLVLTNNHVIDGSTEISVTTDDGATYTATVVGSDATEDVAVLQLEDAANLTTATIDDDDDLAVGDAIAAIGNANGAGELLSASGVVTALDASVTPESGTTLGTTQTLTEMIQIDADVVSGDSGGAVLDEEGEVVGVTTAASSGTEDIVGFAIPIDEALDVAQDIIDGIETETNTLGTPAFLGIAIADDASQSGTSQPGTTQQQVLGATVAGVYEDTPAAELGLEAGDVITAIDGISVASASELSALIAEYAPGTQITVRWTTAAGEAASGTATLIAGPA